MDIHENNISKKKKRKTKQTKQAKNKLQEKRENTTIAKLSTLIHYIIVTSQ